MLQKFHFLVVIFVILLTKALFWVTSFLVVYPYLIYPLILVAANRLGLGRGLECGSIINHNGQNAKSCPTVSIIVAAYNEGAVIASKIENALQLTYPNSIEVIVISDGSTDDTAAIVKSYSRHNENVRLIEMPQQSGKTVGLNAAVLLATGEILVFTDANALYDSEALMHLVKPFDAADVGYTVGSALYIEDDIEAVNISEGLYWRYELFVKRLESDFFSVVGGDGAIYAIRKSLYQPLESYDISDFVNPLQIIAKNFRGLFIPEARSFEHGTEEFSDEFRRKRRIVNRSWGAVRRNLSLFSWRRHTRFLFMLISHKVIRWWTFPLVLLSVGSGCVAAVLSGQLLYLILTAVIVSSIVLGIIGWQLDESGIPMPRFVYYIYYFYLISLAGLLGIVDELRGHRQTVWRPLR